MHMISEAYFTKQSFTKFTEYWILSENAAKVEIVAMIKENLLSLSMKELNSKQKLFTQPQLVSQIKITEVS